MRIVLLAAAGLLLAAPAAADVSERPDNVEDCLKAAQGITMEVDFCLSDEAERQEVLMAAAYAKALRLAEDSQRVLLERSQAEFLTYRETWCEAKSAFMGSGANSYRGQCLIRTTKERIAGLEGFDSP